MKFHAGSITFFIVMLVSFSTFAKEVYQWVDKNGKSHFSDSPPPESYNAKTITLETIPPAPDDSDNEYSIINQAKRMQESRDAIDARKQAALDREAQRKKMQPQQPVIIQNYSSRGGGGYYPYYYPRYPVHYQRPIQPSRPTSGVNFPIR